MSARTYSQAIGDYQRRIQLQCNCVSPFIVEQSGTHRILGASPTIRLNLSLNHGTPVTLKGQTQMAMIISQNVRVVNTGSGSGQRLWRVNLASYTYSLLNSEGAEICSYQWHPEGQSHIKTPHLHIGRGATGNVSTFGPRGLHRVHFPTGKVGLADVIQLAITEFGVEPRRQDWEQVLARE